jgi:hypothetical protein
MPVKTPATIGYLRMALGGSGVDGGSSVLILEVGSRFMLQQRLHHGNALVVDSQM